MEKAEVHMLKTLFWEATLRCNAKCVFCGSRCGEKKQQAISSEVSSEEICACFKEVSERYNARDIMINVTGGEPLLRQDLFDVMGYAHGLGFPWGMVTNGTLITKETIQKMQESRMRTISISLDGLSQTHNCLRKLEAGFEKVKEAAKHLREADFLDEIQITTVVNHENINELEDLFLHVQDMEVDSWRLAVVDPVGRAYDNRNLLLSKEELDVYFDFFQKHQFNGRTALTTSCSHFLGDKDNLYRSHSFSCESGKTVASVLANGDIFVCPNVERRPELIQGNIKTDSFCERWEKGFVWFRKEERQSNESCRLCGHWEQCKGDSLHTWDFVNNRPKFCWKYYEDPANTHGNGAESLIDKIGHYYTHLQGLRISYQSSSRYRVVFLPDASEEMRIFFAWGNCHPRNRYELLAGLAGHMVENCFMVEAVIPCRLEKRSQTEAGFSGQCYQELLDELKIMNSCREFSDEKYRLFPQEYQLLGIAHTHPNDLHVSMSSPDMQLHEKMLQLYPWFLSVIVNPQKREISAFFDSVYSPVDLEILNAIYNVQ